MSDIGLGVENMLENRIKIVKKKPIADALFIIKDHDMGFLEGRCLECLLEGDYTEAKKYLDKKVFSDDN